MSDFKRIGEFASVRRGASPRPIDDPKWFGGKIGWVRIVDVTRSKRYLRSTEQYLSPIGEARSVRVNPGDLIMSICATIGRPMMVDMAACIHDGFVLFYDINGADTEYLYYALQHAEAEFLGYGQLGTQANLNTSIVSNHRLFVPRLPQQRKIARILTTVDNLIEKTESLIAKYESIKQGMMHDLFTRGVDAHGQLRPPYAQAPELYKDSELGWIPKEWDCVRCTEVCREVVVGIVIQPSQYYRSEGVPVLRSANVRETGIAGTDLVFMSEKSNHLLAKSMLRSGDVITVRTGYPGTSCVVSPKYDRSNCVDIIISRPGSSIRSQFLATWINSDLGKNQVLRKQGGLAQQHFNVGELKDLLVFLPSLEEQAKIESVLLTHKLNVQAEESRRDKLQLVKAGLMQDLLTGKVRVNVDAENTDE